MTSHPDVNHTAIQFKWRPFQFVFKLWFLILFAAKNHPENCPKIDLRTTMNWKEEKIRTINCILNKNWLLDVIKTKIMFPYKPTSNFIAR